LGINTTTKEYIIDGITVKLNYTPEWVSNTDENPLEKVTGQDTSPIEEESIPIRDRRD